MNREIIDGIVVFDENDNPLGKSKKAAVKGITQVVISRVAMAAPGMSEFRARQIKNNCCKFNIYFLMTCIKGTSQFTGLARLGKTSLNFGILHKANAPHEWLGI